MHAAPPGYSIALARGRDLPMPVPIERAAARLLLGHAPPTMLERATELHELTSAGATVAVACEEIYMAPGHADAEACPPVV